MFSVGTIVKLRLYVVWLLIFLVATASAAFAERKSRTPDQILGVYFVKYKGVVSSAWLLMPGPSSSALALARAARISGDVVMRATLDTDGTVAELEAISGHPLLIPAAMEAVKLWRRKPRNLKEDETPFIDTITFEFSWALSPDASSIFHQAEMIKTVPVPRSGR